jgi:hypothetical protein
MNTSTSFSQELTSQFQPVSIENPVHVGQSIRYASRVAKIVSVKASYSLTDRVSWSDIDITVINGKSKVTTKVGIVELSAHDSIAIPAMVEHTIDAISDVRLVISFGQASGEVCS